MPCTAAPVTDPRTPPKLVTSPSRPISPVHHHQDLPTPLRAISASRLPGPSPASDERRASHHNSTLSRYTPLHWRPSNTHLALPMRTAPTAYWTSLSGQRQWLLAAKIHYAAPRPPERPGEQRELRNGDEQQAQVSASSRLASHALLRAQCPLLRRAWNLGGRWAWVRCLPLAGQVTQLLAVRVLVAMAVEVIHLKTTHGDPCLQPDVTVARDIPGSRGIPLPDHRDVGICPPWPSLLRPLVAP